MTEPWEQHPETGLTTSPTWRDRGAIIAQLIHEKQSLEQRIIELEAARATDDESPHCLNDHTHGPAIGERINGMAGEHEVVDLYCANCLGRNQP